MEVTTATGKRITNGQTIALTDLKSPLADVNWSGITNGRLYTVALWNATSVDSPKMHFLAVNVPTKGRIVIPYSQPTPDPGYNDLYQLSVWEQQSEFPVYSAERHTRFRFPTNWVFSREVPGSPVNFYVKDNPGHSSNGHSSNGSYFKPGHSLTDKQEKFCRCVLHVAAKQPADCLKSKNYGSKGCYNPYAVCAKSTGTSVGRSGKCGQSYDFNGIPDNELKAYSMMNGITVPSPYSRNNMLANIAAWKGELGK